MINHDIEYKAIKPDAALAAFVDSFWMLHNRSDKDKPVIGLPDGRIDLFFSRSLTEPFHVTLLGVGTHSDQAVISAGRLLFAVSFRLPACEYILQTTVADILNYAKRLPDDFWGFSAGDLNDFNAFCKTMSQKLLARLPRQIDERKLRLFELVYAHKGNISVNEISETVNWSPRQINRYFNQQFGLSLKAYCNVLRFRASLDHIAEGKLFPELNFTDQNHFIKEIKKFSGVIPKELFKNQNDRFILLSAIRGQ